MTTIRALSIAARTGSTQRFVPEPGTVATRAPAVAAGTGTTHPLAAEHDEEAGS